MGPTCPFDDTALSTNMHDADGYSMFICPECDARFRADAFVGGDAVPLARAGDTIVFSVPGPVRAEVAAAMHQQWEDLHTGTKCVFVSNVEVAAIVAGEGVAIVADAD